jgi:hypothetical protein
VAALRQITVTAVLALPALMPGGLSGQSQPDRNALGCYSIAGQNPRNGEQIEVAFRLTPQEAVPGRHAFVVNVEPGSASERGAGMWTWGPESILVSFDVDPSPFIDVSFPSLTLSFPRLGDQVPGTLGYFVEGMPRKAEVAVLVSRSAC